MSRTTKMEMARILTAVASLADSMTLMASHAPKGQWVRERSGEPRPGDLVVEMTHRKWKPWCIGWLVKVVDEPIVGAEEWTEDEEGRPAPLDRFYYVRPLTGGEVVRWYNCRMVALPSAPSDVYHWGEDMPAAIEWHASRESRSETPRMTPVPGSQAQR